MQASRFGASSLVALLAACGSQNAPPAVSLHHLFTAESETVTQYIQRRRLEEAARALLVAAPVRGRLVTEIAFDYGFNSLTHFGRVFRHQFGLTPSEYRRAARSLSG